jgi:transposase
MISIGAQRRVFVSTRPVDFRKGVHGLVALVAEDLKCNPYCGDVYVFRAKRKDRLKLLLFDGSGTVLATKWLENSDFAWCHCTSKYEKSFLGISMGCRVEEI